MGLGVLPVELVSFDAQMDGDAVSLLWRTASETNNAGFEIQHRYAGADKDGAFETLAFVPGHGTTDLPQHYQHHVEALEPGRHTFRLRQIDYDGAFAYSPEVEVELEMPTAFLIDPVYPNPFNPEATLRFGVRQGEQVTVSLFDVLGRRVRVLYAGSVEAGVMQEVRIDGSGLPSGLYVVRVVGERFVETQTVSLVK